jgi:UDP-3-O-[3-hydroxymyristoyl] glucosamine N-acyltransferase
LRDFLKSIFIEFEFNGVLTYASSFSAFDELQVDSCSWSKKIKVDLCPEACAILLLPKNSEVNRGDIAIFQVENPRYTIAKIINHFWDFSKNNIDSFIHQSLNIGTSSFIGSNCRVGENVSIGSNVLIEENVCIGNNVTIGSGCVIGSIGFGFVQNSDGQYDSFPHIGGVKIKDNVYIGSNTCIDRGGLGDTIIGKGTKISNQCQIGHNVKIGSNVLVTGRVLLGGGCFVGDNVYIGPGAIISNKISIGDNADIKIGSVVVNNVGNHESVSGNFSMCHKRNLMNHAKLKRDI